MPLSAQKIASLVDGKTTESATWEAEGLSTDTRTLGENQLFAALIGEKFDGHHFATNALEKGAAGLLVSRVVEGIPAEKQIIVPDTLEAMATLGAKLRAGFRGRVIGITGSAGKTTTREGVKAVLSHFGKTYGTEKNYNNHIGVPITLCNMPDDADYAVYECAMSAAKEIGHLTAMVKPDVALITNIYPMHIEFFESLEGIAHAKAEIFEGLEKTGTAIYSKDANHADILRAKAEALGIENILTFGKNADIALTSHTEENGQSHVEADVAGVPVSFTLSSPGLHRVYNALAILAVVHALGLDAVKAAKHLDDVGLLAGRGKTTRLPLPHGRGHFTLIDESYSGQPEAMKLAIENLKNTTPEAGGRRIAVLGQMAELGAHSEAEHRAVGQAAAAAKLDLIIGVGEQVKPLLKEAEKSTDTIFKPTAKGLAEDLLSQNLRNGDVVLVKGSRYGSRVFEAVDALLAANSSANAPANAATA